MATLVYRTQLRILISGKEMEVRDSDIPAPRQHALRYHVTPLQPFFFHFQRVVFPFLILHFQEQQMHATSSSMTPNLPSPPSSPGIPSKPQNEEVFSNAFSQWKVFCHLSKQFLIVFHLANVVPRRTSHAFSSVCLAPWCTSASLSGTKCKTTHLPSRMAKKKNASIKYGNVPMKMPLSFFLHLTCADRARYQCGRGCCSQWGHTSSCSWGFLRPSTVICYKVKVAPVP